MAVPDGLEMPPVNDVDVEPPAPPEKHQLRRSRKERKGYSKTTFMQDRLYIAMTCRWKLDPKEGW